MKRTVKMKKAAKNKRAAMNKRMGGIDVTAVPYDGISSREVLEQLIKMGMDLCWDYDPDKDKMTLVI